MNRDLCLREDSEIVRLALFLSYLGALVATIAIFSLGVVYQLKQRRRGG